MRVGGKSLTYIHPEEIILPSVDLHVMKMVVFQDTAFFLVGDASSHKDQGPVIPGGDGHRLPAFA